MRTDGYWQNFSREHKIFLSILTFTLISGFLFGDFLGIFYLCFFATIIYVIFKATNKKAKKPGVGEIRQNEPAEVMKKTTFLFDKPVTSDWLFWVFTVSLGANVINGASNVVNSGGLVFSTGGIISGLLDGLFRVLFAWFPLIPIIYLIRKLIRKRKKSGTNGS